ncbi:MAG TPA: hypothetical protein VFH27_15140 [Longimicrobiaceae bacterium]|nr:hypothetical protein [Longimicrobiaceae bacterium]
MSRTRTLALAAALLWATVPAAAQQRVWVPSTQTPARGTVTQPAPAPAPPPAQTPAPGHGGGYDHHRSGDGYGSGYGYGYGQTIPPDLPNCTVTLSGALSGTYGCSSVQTEWRRGEGISTVRILSNPGQQILNRPALEVSVGFGGAPLARGAHTNRDAVQGTAVWLRYIGAIWGAQAGGPGLPSGGYALYLARANDTGETGYGRAYSAGGTLTADLPAYSSASGPVHVEVRF